MKFLHKAIEEMALLASVSISRIKSLHNTLAMFAIVILPACVGCGSKSPWETTHPASGTITYKGRPIENAELAFFPTDPNSPDFLRPRARSTTDGKFTIWTYEQGDGAPAGKYKVTVVHNEVTVSKDTVVAKPNDLPPKYSKLDKTDLEVTIVAGKNELPVFELR